MANHKMLEVALWSAVRALEEQMILAKRIVERARKSNHPRAATLFEKRAEQAEADSSVIRQLLLGDEKDDIADRDSRYEEVSVSTPASVFWKPKFPEQIYSPSLDGQRTQLKYEF